MLNNAILKNLYNKISNAVSMHDTFFGKYDLPEQPVQEFLYGTGSEEESENGESYSRDAREDLRENAPASQDNSFERTPIERGNEYLQKTDEQKFLHHMMDGLQDILEDNKKRLDVKPAPVLTPEEAKLLQERYQSFADLCREYINRKDITLAVGDITAALVPINHYISTLDRIARGELTNMTLAQVLGDDHQLDGLFTADNVPEEDEEEEEISEHYSPKKTIDDYKEALHGLSEKTCAHVAVISGAVFKDRRYDVMKAKLELLDEVLYMNDTEAMKDSLEMPHPLTPILVGWRSVEENADNKNFSDFNEKVMSTVNLAPTLVNSKKILAVVKGKGLSPEAEKSILNELNKVAYNKPDQLGITGFLSKKLDNGADFINTLVRDFNAFAKGTAGKFPKHADDDKNHPAHELYLVMQSVCNKAYNTLNETKNTPKLIEDDLKLFAKKVREYIGKQDAEVLVKEGKGYRVSEFVKNLLGFVDKIGQLYPPLQNESQACREAIMWKTPPKKPAAKQKTEKADPATRLVIEFRAFSDTEHGKFPEDAAEDTKHPAHELYMAMQDICSRIGSGADHDENRLTVTEDDLKNFVEKTREYISKDSTKIMVRRGSSYRTDSFLTDLIRFAFEAGEICPSLKNEAQVCMKLLKDKAPREYEKTMKKLIQTSKDDERCDQILEAALKHVRGMYYEGYISREQEEKAEMICMSRSSDLQNKCLNDYRIELKMLLDERDRREARTEEYLYHLDSLIDAPDQLKDQTYYSIKNKYTGIKVSEDEEILRLERLIAAGEICGIEQGSYHDIVSGSLSFKEECEKMPAQCMAYAASANPGKTLDVQKAEEVVNYLNGYLDQPGMKKRYTLDAQAIGKRFLNEQNSSNYVKQEYEIGFQPLKFLKLEEVEFNALTQESGNFNSDNSEEYNNIKDYVRLLNRGRHAGGATAQELESLYSVCQTYTLDHDSWAWSDNGKLRYNAAAMIVRRLTIPLVLAYNGKDNADPGKVNTLEYNMKFNMIRSQQFRNALAADAQNRLNKLKDIKGALTDYQLRAQALSQRILNYARNLDNELKDTRHLAVTGKMETAEKRAALMNRFERCFREDPPEIQAGPQVPAKA